MIPYRFTEGTELTDLDTVLRSVEQTSGVQGLVVLGCIEAAPATPALSTLLQAQSLPLVGGLFPGVLLNGVQYSRGFLVIGLTFAPQTCVLRDLSQPATDLDELLADWNPGAGTLMTLVDAASERVPLLVQTLFRYFGLSMQHLGGGAGALSLQQQPCILCNDGVLADAAVLWHIPLLGTMGVAHGWQPASGPAMVTAVDGKTVVSLEARRASEIYAAWLQAALGEQVGEHQLDPHLAAFPLGLARLGAEPLVRDLFAVTSGGGLRLVSEIPEGAHVQLLRGELDALLDAAAQVRDDVCARHPGPFQFAVLIDCVSRALFMKGNFQQELAVFAGLQPVFGALTIGELAGDGSGYLELLNKSVALALFGPGESVG